MTLLLLASVLPPLVIAWLAAFAVRRFAPQWGWIDAPGGRKRHAAPVPLGGGIAVWLAVVLPLAAGQIALWTIVAGVVPRDSLPAIIQTHLGGLIEQSGRLWIVVAGGTVLLVVGLIDDLRVLDWRLRLAAQTLVAAFMVWQGFRLTAFLDVPWLTAALSVAWIVGIVNSFNMLDNMDGLSSGVAAIAAAVLAAAMLTAPEGAVGGPQLFVGGYLLLLVGAVSGFLWHNHAPARLFLGDAGSYFLGYWIAIGTLMATFAGDDLPRHAILAPLCVMAIPLYDTASVVYLRLRGGRSVFVGDTSHFSHRLVDLGLSPKLAVRTIYLATLTCSLGALVLQQVDIIGAAVVIAIVVSVLAIIAILESAARRGKDNRNTNPD